MLLSHVGHDAVASLEERDTECLREVMDAVGVRTGAEQVLVQVDSGGVPVGELVRPKRVTGGPREPGLVARVTSSSMDSLPGSRSA